MAVWAEAISLLAVSSAEEVAWVYSPSAEPILSAAEDAWEAASWSPGTSVSEIWLLTWLIASEALEIPVAAEVIPSLAFSIPVFAWLSPVVSLSTEAADALFCKADNCV